jgi:hypothetical protein
MRALCEPRACLLFASPVIRRQGDEASSAAATYSTLNPVISSGILQAASQGSVEMVVSLPLAVAYILPRRTLIGVTTVSTGKPGTGNAHGTFEILQKRKEHYSQPLRQCPMPFMQRLTWDGIALHAARSRASGLATAAVRLPMA